jgi:hypothetical protein
MISYRAISFFFFKKKIAFDLKPIYILNVDTSFPVLDRHILALPSCEAE